MSVEFGSFTLVVETFFSERKQVNDEPQTELFFRQQN
jgi:hypothetical protein